MVMKLSRLMAASLWYLISNRLSRNVTDEVATTENGSVWVSKWADWLPTKPVVVKRNGVELQSSDYVVDYKNGWVTLIDQGSTTDIVLVSYAYTWVEMTTSFPEIDSDDIPVAEGGRQKKSVTIAIHDGPEIERGLQIGGGAIVNATYYVNVFAPNGDIRKDVSQEIRELFDQDAPLIDFNVAQPINYDGTKNPAFDLTAQTIGKLTFFDVVVTGNPSGSDDPLEIGRALVEFEIETTRE